MASSKDYLQFVLEQLSELFGNTATRRLLYVQLLYMGLFIMNCCVYNNVG